MIIYRSSCTKLAPSNNIATQCEEILSIIVTTANKLIFLYFIKRIEGSKCKITLQLPLDFETPSINNALYQ
jgi:hypothetical protein